MLIELAEQYPHYGFAENKAYASPQHLAALLEHGPSHDPPLLLEPARVWPAEPRLTGWPTAARRCPSLAGRR